MRLLYADDPWLIAELAAEFDETSVRSSTPCSNPGLRDHLSHPEVSADGVLEWERHLALGWGTSQLSALARYEVFIAQVFRPYLPGFSHR